MSGLRPYNIPSQPQSIYKNDGWKGWGDFLGTGRIADNKKIYRTFKEVKKYVRNLAIQTKNDWIEHSKSGNKPNDIPMGVSRTYSKEWKGWADFLGKE